MKGKTETQGTRAWVVFSGQTDLLWLRGLRSGFRHCYVLLHDGARWISIDPMAHYMEVTVHHVPRDFDLPRWLENRGHTVVSALIDRSCRRAAPLMPFSCVEAVKRTLGIHSRFIITPWQLYRHLTRESAGAKAPRLGLFRFNLLHKGVLSWEV